MPAGPLDFIKDHPAGVNNALEQGATFYRELIYRDSAGAVVDLSTYTARMKIRLHKDSGDVLASWSTTTEITLAATAPNIIISVTAAATAALDWSGLAYYDLELDDGAITPAVTRLIEGRIELSKEVSY